MNELGGGSSGCSHQISTIRVNKLGMAMLGTSIRRLYAHLRIYTFFFFSHTMMPLPRAIDVRVTVATDVISFNDVKKNMRIWKDAELSVGRPVIVIASPWCCRRREGGDVPGTTRGEPDNNKRLRYFQKSHLSRVAGPAACRDVVIVKTRTSHGRRRCTPKVDRSTVPGSPKAIN